MSTINGFIPMKIEQWVNNATKQVITSERWNELWNLNVTQGDHSEAWLQNLVDAHNTLIVDTTASLALKSDKAVTNQHYKAVAFNANNGIFTFTREDGSFTTIDTALEKVATNWQYDPITQELVLTLADGSTQRVSLSAFITENEFVDSSTVVFSVASHKVTAGIKPGSLNDTHLTSAFVASLQNYVTQAQASATAAANSATDAAASAALASNRATAASGSAASAANSKDAAATYSTNASNAATAASGSATSASSSAGAASSSAAKSESWAVGGTGTRPGEDTNNAKYWAGKAEEVVGGGFATKIEAQGFVNAHNVDDQAHGALFEAPLKDALAKAYPVDNDGIVLVDNADGKTKRVLWSSIKTTLKTWLDTLYATVSHTHAWSAITGKPTSFAPSAHTHAPTDLTTAVPITKGGTGATTAAAARAALDVPSTADITVKRPNIISTLPIATGQTIAAKDVVNIVSNQITKAGTPTQAIALQSGTAGQSIDIIFDGVAELPGITAGTQITSSGVQGFAPQGGWLWVRPYWDGINTATYTGNNALTRTIDFGVRGNILLLRKRVVQYPLNLNTQTSGEFVQQNGLLLVAGNTAEILMGLSNKTTFSFDGSKLSLVCGPNLTALFNEGGVVYDAILI